jgi:alkylation response protein AidB-like acyl-CoA dehydrogenase
MRRDSPASGRCPQFTEDHEAFRALARNFVEKEVVPAYPEWEKAGRMPRDVFKQMGAFGMLGMAIPEEYGGAGMPDYRYNVVLQEEAARALVTLSTVRTQLEVILPYFLHYANEEQRKRWFPGLADGTLLTAVAMTEPGTGSDLAGIRTTAVRDGDHWIVNGAKTFITGRRRSQRKSLECDPCHRRQTNLLCVQLVGWTKESGARNSAVRVAARQGRGSQTADPGRCAAAADPQRVA